MIESLHASHHVTIKLVKRWVVMDQIRPYSQLFDKEWHLLFNLDNMEQRIFYFFEASISLLKY
jgi:hypothetical protein